MIPKLTILYEDDQLLVCVKPAGVPCQSDKSGAYDLCSRIRNYLLLAAGDRGIPYVGIIHRLDRPVGGVMVYAKTPAAAACLSRDVKLYSEDPQKHPHLFQKGYTAILCQRLPAGAEPKAYPAEGVLESCLKKLPKENRSVVTDRNDPAGKYSCLSYRITVQLSIPDDEQTLFLQRAEISLKTGRHHQIRVQCAAHLSGLWADSRYHALFQAHGIDYRHYAEAFSRWYTSCHDHACPALSVRDVALFSHSLSFRHPVTKELLTFHAEPEGSVFGLFN